MKFAIRDDDLNWFFSPELIDRQLSDIWDVCPVSMSAIPSVVGNWERNTLLLDKYGPTGTVQALIDSIKAEKRKYMIGDNAELVEYIKGKIRERRVHLTIHGITHRNNDPVLPYLNNNHAIGAEFFTKLDLEEELIKAKTYLENVFGQKISVFTPPQNALSETGMNAVQMAGLNICGDIPSLRFPGYYASQLGLVSYLRVLAHKILEPKKMPFPKVLKMKKACINSHSRVQPKTNLDQVKSEIEYVYRKNGNFVLSTHSYGFDHQMEGQNITLKEGVLDIINFAKSLPLVNFVTLDQIFQK